MRVGVYFNRIGPYHTARLNAASKLGEVVAFELTNEDRVYSWDIVKQGRDFASEMFLDEGAVKPTSLRELRTIIFSKLDQHSLDVLAIPGWGFKSSLLCLQWCIIRGKTAVLMSDSFQEKNSLQWVSKLGKVLVLKGFSSAIVAGTPHRDYLVSLGFDASRIFLGYDVVDNIYFANESNRYRDPVFTPDFTQNERKYFLICARLIKEKNIRTALFAYKKYIDMAPDIAWGMVIVGDGPERPQLEELVLSLDLSDRVVFTGFKQYENLPRFYSRAGALILPSTSETWGLVVNEAMASAVPVLVSSACGCTMDLVDDGDTGIIFDPGNPSELAANMFEIASNERLRQHLSEAALLKISDWDVNLFAASLWSAATDGKHPATFKTSAFKSRFLNLAAMAAKNV